MTKSGMTTYKLVFTRTFKKTLKKIDKQYHRGIQKEIDNLVNDPYSKLDKIQNPNIVGAFKTRKGVYRILLEIDDKQIILHAVKHRKDIYNIK